MSYAVERVRTNAPKTALARQQEQPISSRHRSYCSPMEGVVSALLVTVGLVSGVIALVPKDVISQLPLVHLAIAFFIPYASLFAFTELNLRIVRSVMCKGVLTALLLGTIAYGVAFATQLSIHAEEGSAMCMRHQEMTCQLRK